MREDRDNRRRVEILGIPMDLGQGRRGVDMGPSALRYANLQDALARLGHGTADLGNISVPIPEAVEQSEDLPHLKTIGEVCQKTAAIARNMVEGGAFPIFLGGDHSTSIGTVSGITAAGRTGVIWLDAHADLNTPETSPSGNVHGMPLAALTGRGHPDLVNVGGEGAGIRPEDAVLVGLRSVDPEERELLAETGIRAYTMKDIDAHGVATVVHQALKDLSHLDWVHLSFDLDVLDPDIAPGVGTPVRGGLTYREAHLVMELINETDIVTSLDIVEVNPILDRANGTAQLAVELVASLLGQRILDLAESS